MSPFRRREAGSMEERFLRRDAGAEVRRTSLHPTAQMVLLGLGRVALYAGAAAGAGAGIGAGVALLRGSDDPLGGAILGLYLVGAALVGVPLVSWSGRSYSSGGGYEFYEVETDPASRRAWQGQLGAYLLIGMIVIGMGVVLEVLRQ